MANLSCQFAGLEFKNPIIMASGTFGFGKEYEQFYPISSLGGICGKGLTMHPRAGNKGERMYETASGMLNSVGLENQGIAHFLKYESDYWETLDTTRIVNLGGSSIYEYVQGASLIEDHATHRQLKGRKSAFDMIELNISCPNVKAGGIAYGIKTAKAREVVREVRKVTSLPLMVKLSPAAEDIVDMAGMCEQEGADAVSVVNTFTGMKIDVHRRRSHFDNLYAGLSGPAIKPIALRMVHQITHQLQIPVVGIGGITSAEDIIEFIMAGAAAVQVGTYNLMNTLAGPELIADLQRFMIVEGISSLNEIRGIV